MLSFKFFIRFCSIAGAGLLLSIHNCSAEQYSPPPGFEAQSIEINGLDFHYLEKGDGDPILFLHGFPFDSETWVPLMESLSVEFQTVALDARGYPRSDSPTDIESYRIENLVSDVEQLIKSKFEGKAVTLVGHDWGATLAFTVTQAHPELVSRLVAINAPPYNIFLQMLAENEAQRAAAAYIPRLKTLEFEEVLIKNKPASLWAFGMNKLEEAGKIDEGFKLRYFDTWSEGSAITAGINWYRANIPDFDDITDADYWPAKDSRITVPTLLLWSDGEPAFTKDTLERIPTVVDKLTIEVIENAGHMVQFEHKDAVLKHIVDFLQ